MPCSDSSRRVSVLDVDRPAMVLGSTQRDEIVDHDAARGTAGRHRSPTNGWGSRLSRTDTTVWIDVVIPSDDPLWRDDIAHAFDWFGQAWHAALRAVGVDSDDRERCGRLPFGARSARLFRRAWVSVR